MPAVALSARTCCCSSHDDAVAADFWLSAAATQAAWSLLRRNRAATPRASACAALRGRGRRGPTTTALAARAARQPSMTPMHRPEGVLDLAKARGRKPAKGKSKARGKGLAGDGKGYGGSAGGDATSGKKATVIGTKLPEAAMAARVVIKKAPTRNGTTNSALQPLTSVVGQNASASSTSGTGGTCRSRLCWRAK